MTENQKTALACVKANLDELVGDDRKFANNMLRKPVDCKLSRGQAGYLHRLAGKCASTAMKKAKREMEAGR